MYVFSCQVQYFIFQYNFSWNISWIFLRNSESVQIENLRQACQTSSCPLHSGDQLGQTHTLACPQWGCTERRTGRHRHPLLYVLSFVERPLIPLLPFMPYMCMDLHNSPLLQPVLLDLEPAMFLLINPRFIAWMLWLLSPLIWKTALMECLFCHSPCPQSWFSLINCIKGKNQCFLLSLPFPSYTHGMGLVKPSHLWLTFPPWEAVPNFCTSQGLAKCHSAICAGSGWCLLLVRLCTLACVLDWSLWLQRTVWSRPGATTPAFWFSWEGSLHIQMPILSPLHWSASTYSQGWESWCMEHFAPGGSHWSGKTKFCCFIDHTQSY